MAEKKEINCDHCGIKLNEFTSYSHRWGLHLEPRDYRANTCGISFAMVMTPDIGAPMDFCGLGCLCAWVNLQQEGGQ